MVSFCYLQNDLQADIQKFQLPIPESMDKLELLISNEKIKEKIEQVAKILDAEYAGEEITIVMVMKGAICLTADLIRELESPCTVEYVKASSYGHRGTQRGELKVIGLDSLNLEGKNVLLVDDIYDSGATLTQILARLQEKNPKTLKSLVLLAKKVDRHTSYLPDYVLFEIENHFVIGYGLDYKEHYRGLPGIFLFKSDIR